MNSSASTTGEPLLRTLAAALRQLQQNLRTWLDAPHGYPLSTLARATLEGLEGDLARPALESKIIVDTPDLDSNDRTNREKLLQVLPVADIVLYVGSQEKYHDKLGWELFLQQRQRRAFAFVLNKWDRCLHAFASGLRPDEDLLSDLRAEGFENPMLFRTCAQTWVDRAAEGKA